MLHDEGNSMNATGYMVYSSIPSAIVPERGLNCRPTDTWSTSICILPTCTSLCHLLLEKTTCQSLRVNRENEIDEQLSNFLSPAGPAETFEAALPERSECKFSKRRAMAQIDLEDEGSS